MKQHASTLAMSYIAKATSNALRAKKTAFTGVVMAAALASARSYTGTISAIRPCSEYNFPRLALVVETNWWPGGNAASETVIALNAASSAPWASPWLRKINPRLFSEAARLGLSSPNNSSASTIASRAGTTASSYRPWAAYSEAITSRLVHLDSRPSPHAHAARSSNSDTESIIRWTESLWSIKGLA